MKSTSTFHAYAQYKHKTVQSRQRCIRYRKKGVQPIERDNFYGLWPGLANSLQLRDGEELYGYREAIDRIYRHQHPADCSKAKFLVSEGYRSGFGSHIHVIGAGLTLAINLGRVFIMQPPLYKYWETNTEFCKCQKIESMECYFRRLTNCSLHDAGLLGHDIYGRELNPAVTWSFPVFSVYDKDNLYSPETKTVMLSHNNTPYREIPRKLLDIVRCSPMKRRLHYYWWRAVSATYMVRPTQATLDYMDKFRSLPVGPSNSDKTISIHVRHGDKHVEMELLPFQQYADVAQQLWSSGLVQNDHGSYRSRNGTIFLSTGTVQQSWCSRIVCQHVVPLYQLPAVCYDDIVPVRASQCSITLLLLRMPLP
jgi:hypothetical protein